MARFKGTLYGQRGPVCRLGNARSGLTVTANGWNIGAVVELRVNDEGKDEILIQVNGGSGGRIPAKAVYQATED